ncbi:hypothetical protein [Bacillus sp. AFS017336]|uniref:hypothetical protein n=1 Tax=Bacillus sp. AFS017336 TaxID=2033489 RepID=UPI000BF124F8|nr:hypothetical protein [Bacillus sp. AFS017336]PEL13551.1 hypothetical protein CN601_03850 [Bacillus sp. AFS017336]
MYKKENKFFSSLNGIQLLLTLLLMSIFLIPQQIREGILGGKIGGLNYIATLILFLILFRYIRMFDLKYVVFLYIFNIYLLISLLFFENKLMEIIIVLLSFSLPLIIIGLKIRDTSLKVIFRIFLSYFNIIILIITILGIIDFLTNYKILLSISKILPARIEELINLQKSTSLYRLFSIYGHPLFNSQLYLMYLILNYIGTVYFEFRTKKYFFYILTTIGIALTASKTGLILLIIALLGFSSRKKWIRNYFILGLMTLIVWISGIFNSTILRLTSGNLTTGREDMWSKVEQYNMFPIKIFTGYGRSFALEYNNYIAKASAAFEYPYRMFALEMGIFFTIILYCFIFVYPVLLLIKRKHYNLLFCYLIIFIDVNTYNGLSSRGDYMLIFSVFTFLILNVSLHKK